MAAVLGALRADPSQLLPARTQMAFTLGFHIILVPLGVAFTFITLLANYRGLKKHDELALTLARRWSKVAAVLFAVGAVSGTVLTFEMGLLWPKLMDRFGAAYGIPFAIEGIFFFTEAIFIAIYIYGWDRMRPWAHWWTGVPVVLSGVGGALAVVAANSWMNQPGGFTLHHGRVASVDPLSVIFNKAFWYEGLHMLLAAYLVAGFLVASVYATGMLRGRRDRYHRLGFLIPFSVAALAMPFQIVVGDSTARAVFHHQSSKYAAIELVPKTKSDRPEIIGGWYENGKVTGPRLEIPGLASLLSGYSTDTTIKGLGSMPARDRPPANIVHLAWDVMIGLAFALLALVAWFIVLRRRSRDLAVSRGFLLAASFAGVASVICMEAGWIVTEVGRQPWIVYRVLRTRDAVTHADGVWVSLVVVLAIYALVGIASALVLRGMARRWRAEDEPQVPYGPPAPVATRPSETAGV